MWGQGEGRGVRREREIIVKVVNVQGLTKTKGMEIEELINDNSIVCLTETQKKIRDVNFSETFEVIDNMREEKDRKGGGIMVLYRKDRIAKERNKI